MSLLKASFIVALKVVTTLSYGNPFSSFQTPVGFIKGWSFSFSNIFSVNVYLEGSLSTALLSPSLLADYGAATAYIPFCGALAALACIVVCKNIPYVRMACRKANHLIILVRLKKHAK